MDRMVFYLCTMPGGDCKWLELAMEKISELEEVDMVVTNMLTDEEYLLLVLDENTVQILNMLDLQIKDIEIVGDINV